MSALKTYKQWKAKGLQVKKGEHAVGRNSDGVALFRKSQVKATYVNDNDEYYEEDYQHFMDIYGYDRDWT